MLLPAVRHELSFWHGSSRLMGDLVLPPAPGPHPVVINIREPDATERDRSPWLDGLAAAGIACFTWDRVTSPDLPREPARRAAEHAREVLSVIGRLHCEPSVDATAVALLGWGEGGWAAAKAATFSSEVRAVVLAGTPTAAPARLVEHRVIQRLRAAGHAGSDVAAARDVVRRRLAELAVGHPGPWRAPAGHRREAWFDTLVALDVLTATPLAGLPVELSADPLPTLSAVSVPVLALFGEQDPTLPLEDSVRGVRQALHRAGHGDHRVAVVRGGDRALRVRPEHGLGAMVDGRHQFGEWPVGLTGVIVEWLDARIRTVPDVPAFAPPLAPDLVDGQRSGGSGGPGAPGGRPDGCPLPVRQVRRRISR